MKFRSLSRWRCAGPLCLALLAGLFCPAAMAASLKLEVQLIWGTNDEQSPDPAHKPVSEEVLKKLKGLPFKWKNYFEVKREKIEVAEGETKRLAMSKDCTVSVKNLGKEMVEVQLIGKGEKVGTIKQTLPKKELLATGGNAANATAWLVTLRQTD